MKRATIFTEDDVREYPADVDWCLAYQTRNIEKALDDCLFALHEIYCKCKIDDADFDEMSEVEQMYYARQRTVAGIAAHVINKIANRGLS